ncbi:hypothetical protein OE88DRAFT_1736634 [Heliocybe sulcata]|uniref:Thiamine diphosphate-binding protein n=1 Tax=Heliocybe sulcata TaxID=5364 RepID=A0A5C3MWS4_9AGAM|nr:hypothetical protein OE88DRAFT_1736634 [Heliocybe sulcata]
MISHAPHHPSGKDNLREYYILYCDATRILPVFDAIYNSPHFTFILPRHEQGAGHMAEGYAHVTGKPGIVLVTSGPGATNVVTAMQDAMSDGVPLIVFCCQVATSAIGSDAFQEADIVGISRSCTKWNVMVKDIAELPRRIDEAFKIATSGIIRTPLPYRITTPGMNLGLPANPLQPDALAPDHELIRQAARFDDRVTGKVDTFAPAARAASLERRGGIIHFEIQPKNINKVVETQIPILGDVVSHLVTLVPMIKRDTREGWLREIKEWKEAYMTAMELATASASGVGVKVIVLNNEFQGMVLQWQDLFYDARYSHTRMVNPDFIALAKSMRVHAIKCTSAAELPAKMKELLEYDNSKPVLMECVVETNEHVFPMVPAGKALHQQLLHPSLGNSSKSSL